MIRKLTVGASLAAVVLLGYYAWSTLQTGLEPRKFMALVFLLGAFGIVQLIRLECAIYDLEEQYKSIMQDAKKRAPRHSKKER